MPKLITTQSLILCKEDEGDITLAELSEVADDLVNFLASKGYDIFVNFQFVDEGHDISLVRMPNVPDDHPLGYGQFARAPAKTPGFLQ